MNHQPDELEPHLRHLVARFHYPETPPIATAVRRRTHPGRQHRSRRWALAFGCVVVLLLGMFAPPIRAAVERWWRIGTVEIIVATPEPMMAPTALPEASVAQAPTAPPDPSMAQPEAPTKMLQTTVSPQIAGAVTFAEARERWRFPVLLPTYPAGLGAPDEVYLQGDDASLVLVWNKKQRLSLQVFDSTIVASKMIGSENGARRTTVDGQAAVWIDVPHVLEFTTADGSPNWREGRFVEGNVLIWATDTLTYRVESGLSLEEARRIAESLR